MVFGGASTRMIGGTDQAASQSFCGFGSVWQVQFAAPPVTGLIKQNRGGPWRGLYFSNNAVMSAAAGPSATGAPPPANPVSADFRVRLDSGAWFYPFMGLWMRGTGPFELIEIQDLTTFRVGPLTFEVFLMPKESAATFGAFSPVWN